MKLLQAPCREAMITLQVYGASIQTTQPTGVTGVTELNFTVVGIVANSSLIKVWYSFINPVVYMPLPFNYQRRVTKLLSSSV